ncbi:hypothetical protein HKD37_17G047488 [Glycine soja]
MSPVGPSQIRVQDQEEEEEEVCLLTSCQEEKESSKSLWYLDTACNNHMSGSQDSLNLDVTYRHKIKLGESRNSIMGKGEVRILNKDNTNRLSSMFSLSHI